MARAGVHRRIEIAEVGIAGLGVIHEGPLPPTMLIGPVIAFAREVQPLGMTEFVAHEVEPSFAATDQSNEADHLVERNAAINGRMLLQALMQQAMWHR